MRAAVKYDLPHRKTVVDLRLQVQLFEVKWVAHNFDWPEVFLMHADENKHSVFTFDALNARHLLHRWVALHWLEVGFAYHENLLTICGNEDVLATLANAKNWLFSWIVDLSNPRQNVVFERVKTELVFRSVDHQRILCLQKVQILWAIAEVQIWPLIWLDASQATAWLLLIADYFSRWVICLKLSQLFISKGVYIFARQLSRTLGVWFGA